MKPVFVQLGQDLAVNVNEVQAILKVNGGTQVTFFKGSFEVAYGMEVVEVLDLFAKAEAHG